MNPNFSDGLLDNTTNRGKITVYALEPQSAVYLGVAIDEDFHLS